MILTSSLSLSLSLPLLQPGCNSIQSLESELNGILGELRQTAGKEAMKELPWANGPRIMAECGSKGSPLNISQMIACVGQQSVGGKRIENGFMRRFVVIIIIIRYTRVCLVLS